MSTYFMMILVLIIFNLHVTEGSVIKMSESRIYGTTVGEVQASREIDITRHPEGIQCVRLAALALHHHGCHLNTRVFKLKTIEP